MTHSTRQDRRSEQAATTALLAVMLVLAAATGIENAVHRAEGHASIAPAIGTACAGLAASEAAPGHALLEPPSETLACVGNCSGSQVRIDLAHMAGTGIQRHQRRLNLPPPTMS